LGPGLEAQAGPVDLSLIVLNYNTHELAVACVRSIYEHLRRVT
jgi:GT2 family glycosyltransferase